MHELLRPILREHFQPALLARFQTLIYRPLQAEALKPIVSLKLGKVVGEPTAGWIIYTGGITLIDGSTLRMPATKIFASDGTPMEMHPRPVDVAVVRPVGESYSGKDAQLDAAVTELLKEIGGRPKTTSSEGDRRR